MFDADEALPGVKLPEGPCWAENGAAAAGNASPHIDIDVPPSVAIQDFRIGGPGFRAIELFELGKPKRRHSMRKRPVVSNLGEGE